MPYIVIGLFCITLQLLLSAIAFLLLFYHFKGRQDREHRRNQRQISRISRWTEAEIEKILGSVTDFQTITSDELKAINKRADEALNLANDMSRRFDAGEKPKPNVNVLSLDQRRDAREAAYVRKMDEQNAGKSAEVRQ
jgi:hypothetical protein